MKALVALVIVIIIAIVYFFYGGESTPIDSEPFEPAIVQYLKSNNFGMSVTEFESLTVDGDNAEASCKLKEASGLYDMTVTWKFKLVKKGDSWKVLSHKE